MRDPAKPLEISVGAHVLCFEPPDVYVCRLVGDLSGPEADRCVDEVNEFASGERWIFSINDLTRGNFSASARRAVMRITPLLRGSAVIGAGKRTQLVLSLVRKAFNVVNPRRTMPIAFFDTEAEARVWVGEQRRILETAEERGGAKGATR